MQRSRGRAHAIAAAVDGVPWAKRQDKPSEQNSHMGMPAMLSGAHRAHVDRGAAPLSRNGRRGYVKKPTLRQAPCVMFPRIPTTIPPTGVLAELPHVPHSFPVGSRIGLQGGPCRASRPPEDAGQRAVLRPVSTTRRLLHVKHRLEDLPHAIAVVDLRQWVLAQAVAQAQRDDSVDVLRRNLRAAFKRGNRLGGAVSHNVTADAIHIELRADLRNLHSVVVRHLVRLEQLLRVHDALSQRALPRLVALAELGRVLVKLLALRHNLHAQLGLLDSADLRVHAEAVEQLRPQLTLLGVATADEDETGGVADGDALALHRVPACAYGARVR
eukprot:302059-Chlamydomonas_euryale.AAC.1